MDRVIETTNSLLTLFNLAFLGIFCTVGILSAFRWSIWRSSFLIVGTILLIGFGLSNWLPNVNFSTIQYAKALGIGWAIGIAVKFAYRQFL